ncbi:MAG: hypothetical protein JWR15_1252 [Prosthecobacter sp.]|nr:hypothetical protein [Prosthecobacter sp.]
MTPPSAPHTALFIYSECFTQSETARRFHVFAKLDNSDRTVIFYARDVPGRAATDWRQHELTSSLAAQIEDAFGALRIPLHPGVRAWNDQHHHRSIELETPGASLFLGWDADESLLADALAPLTHLIMPLVDEMKADLEANDLP